MNKLTTLYFLYCLNKECQFSIYQLMVELRVPLTPKNLGSVHTCTCCQQPLVSSIDMEIKQMVTQTKAKMLNMNNLDYLNN